MIFITAAALFAVSVILVFAAFSASLITGEFAVLLRQIPDSPSEDYKILVSLFGITAATLTAVLSVIVAIWSYLRSSAATRLAQRKQHTITILFETRLSEYFQTTNKLRKETFPVDQDITLSDWRAARTAQSPSNGTAAQVQALHDGADALQQMLNYYEFLAVGIAQHDLDEELLKASIRGIMCNLVDDARIMIAELRQNDPKTMEHVVELYEKWRRNDAINHNGEATERPIPALNHPTTQTKR